MSLEGPLLLVMLLPLSLAAGVDLYLTLLFLGLSARLGWAPPPGELSDLAVPAVLGMAVTAALGRWQLGRAAEKEALQAAIEARAQQPVLDARGVAGMETQLDLLHRRVEARGQWVGERTVFLDNRQMNGRPGFFVVTPLRLEGEGGVLLVQRVPRVAAIVRKLRRDSAAFLKFDEFLGQLALFGECRQIRAQRFEHVGLEILQAHWRLRSQPRRGDR